MFDGEGVGVTTIGLYEKTIAEPEIYELLLFKTDPAKKDSAFPARRIPISVKSQPEKLKRYQVINRASDLKFHK